MLRDLIRSAFRRLGYDVKRYLPESSHDAQLAAMLAKHQISLILDVGANTGQFAETLRKRIGYRGRILSFEPMAAAHEELVKASTGDALWEVAPRMAIGSQPGTATLNVSNNSVSSSVLPMLQAHVAAAPESRYVRQETVPVVTLDAAVADRIRNGDRTFLKVDTQGFESEVLRGAAQVLSQCSGVQLELSLVPLYAGQALIFELWQQMNDSGFELWSMSPNFIDPESARMLQVDATFFRKGQTSHSPVEV
jgi:FkbM family methyltransferase